MLTQEQVRNLDKLIISSFYKLSQTRSRISAAEVTDYLRQRFGDVWNMNKLTSMAEKTLDKSVELGLISKRSGVELKCPKCKLPLKKTRPSRRRRVRKGISKRHSKRRRN